MHEIEDILNMNRQQLREVKEVNAAGTEREKVLEGRSELINRFDKKRISLEKDLADTRDSIEDLKKKLDVLLLKEEKICSEITAEQSASDKVMYAIEQSLDKQHPKNLKAAARN